MGDELYRRMPWREDVRPYCVLVSEMMLQQTQVSRVIPKFEAFITTFPDERALSQASLADVLKSWQGLGYNRRAKYLHDACKMIVAEFDGTVPCTVEELERLPGVGKNTAGAILTYAFNKPNLFIETNIRTVYIYHFFPDRDDVNDKEILEILGNTLDQRNPRKFYQSLMDYGAHLKTTGMQNITRSKHYTRQSTLAGSLREMRGIIIRRLTAGQELTNLSEDARFESALHGLERDGLISRHSTGWRLTI